MTSTSDVEVRYGTITEAKIKQVQDLIGDKGTVYSPEAAQEPGTTTTTHTLTTLFYADSSGHFHAVLIDEVTTSSGTVLEILADVVVT
jgi:hypothetical protein